MTPEHDGDYMVELSKTLWAQRVRVSAEMDSIANGLRDALPTWAQWVLRRVFR